MLFAGDDVAPDCCAVGEAATRVLGCRDGARSDIAKHEAVSIRKGLTIECLLRSVEAGVGRFSANQLIESDNASVSGSKCVAATIRETEKGISTLGKVTGKTSVRNSGSLVEAQTKHHRAIRHRLSWHGLPPT